MKKFFCVFLGLMPCMLFAQWQNQGVYSEPMIGQDGIIPMRVEETFTVKDFHKIQLDVPGDLLITQTDREAFTIEGQKSLIDRVGYLVIDDTLFIKPKEQMSAYSHSDVWRPLVFQVAVIHLNQVDMKEGSVQCDGLRSQDLTLLLGNETHGYLSVFVENLNVTLQGNATLQIKGQAQTQTVVAAGVGVYNATDLLTANARMNIMNNAKAHIHARKSLRGSLRDNAILTYYGIPEVVDLKVSDNAVAQSSAGSGTGRNIPGHLAPKASTIPPTGGIAPPGNTPAEQRPPASSLNNYF